MLQNRVGSQTIANSRINRDGLPAGTPAPAFRLPLVGGGKLSLVEYRGQRLLLVFSDPVCGPCNELAPRLEHLHRSSSTLQILMISRGDQEANHAKVSKHQLTFPVVLQRRWEISRKYGMFATPIAYLVDEQGIVAADVAVGVDAILALATGKGKTMRERIQARLDVLKSELETGQVELQKVERQRTYLQETVLRIGGAIQVLEELLREEQPDKRDEVGPAETQSVATNAHGGDGKQTEIPLRKE